MVLLLIRRIFLRCHQQRDSVRYQYADVVKQIQMWFDITISKTSENTHNQTARPTRVPVGAGDAALREQWRAWIRQNHFKVEKSNLDDDDELDYAIELIMKESAERNITREERRVTDDYFNTIGSDTDSTQDWEPSQASEDPEAKEELGPVEFTEIGDTKSAEEHSTTNLSPPTFTPSPSSTVQRTTSIYHSAESPLKLYE